MSRTRVFCEVANGSVVRIFRKPKQAFLSKAYGERRVIELPRKDATVAIRRAVFNRDNGECVGCGSIVTWEMAHMHEKVPRGQGGEVSVENSVMLCAPCHIGADGKHSNRLPQFTRGRT